MKRCSFCNKEADDAAKHCPSCGKPFEAVCIFCHRPIPSGASFCPVCGGKTEKRFKEEIAEKKEKEEQAREWEELKKNGLLLLLAFGVALVVCVIYPIASVPVGLATFIIFRELKNS